MNMTWPDLGTLLDALSNPSIATRSYLVILGVATLTWLLSLIPADDDDLHGWDNGLVTDDTDH